MKSWLTLPTPINLTGPDVGVLEGAEKHSYAHSCRDVNTGKKPWKVALVGKSDLIQYALSQFQAWSNKVNALKALGRTPEADAAFLQSQCGWQVVADQVFDSISSLANSKNGSTNGSTNEHFDSISSPANSKNGSTNGLTKEKGSTVIAFK